MSSSSPTLRTKITTTSLLAQKQRGEKIVAVTCYDATFAALVDAQAIDIILVGDSLGMVIQGHATTLPVTLDDIIYHARAVLRRTSHAHVVGDMPFMSYQASRESALVNAGRLMKEGGVAAVKLEGGEALAPTVAALVQAGIPVMGHIGLQPQSVHQLGGYKVQGKTANAGERLLAEARALTDAGAYALVLEGVTIEVAAEITKTIPIPTIGINAGAACDGQVLVLYDLLGLDPHFTPRFVKQYANGANVVSDALTTYAREVREGTFPTDAHAVHQLTGTEQQPVNARPARISKVR